MTVVMSLMAILSLMGAPSLISARQQYLVDSVAEDIISSVRTAQNNAISIKDGLCSTGSTRAWYFSVKNNNYAVGSTCFDSSGGASADVDQLVDLKQFPAVTISDDSSYRLYFTTPFARPYLYSEASKPSSWVVSAFFERDIVPTTPATLSDGTITIRLGGHERKLTITANGDISAND